MGAGIHGGDIYSKKYRYDFSANINPFGMPERVKAAAMDGVNHSIHYPDIKCRRLRGAIAKKEDVSEDWIVCGNGAAELIFLLTQTLKPAKAVLVSPGFAEYEQALNVIRCKIDYHLLDQEHDFELDGRYLNRLDETVDIAFLCNPNNPTGLLIDQELLLRILDRCKEKNIFLVMDECFLEFVPQALQCTLIKHIKSMKNLFVLKAFTKMYGMPGLRLGYGLCSDKELLQSMREQIQPWNVSVPAQMAGIAACDEKEWVVKTCDHIEKERAFLSGELKKLGFKVYESKANYLFFEGPEELMEFCNKEGILIRDCSNYRGLSKGFYRIAVRLHEENETLIKCFQKNRKKKI